jgi:predicted RNA-binding Zn ribbon-like protein
VAADGAQLERGVGERLVNQLRFDAGNLSLNLIATVGRRFGTPVERLTDPARLDAWIRGVDLHMRVSNAEMADVERIRVFREHLNELARSIVAGTSPAPMTVAVINAAATATSTQLQATDLGVELHVAGMSVADALIPLIASDFILLVCGPDRSRVRECAASDCRMLFIAQTGGRRNWCSSAHCGNRNRVASHYARTKRHRTRPAQRTTR